MPTVLPFKIDIFALLIFLGIVQGFFLAYFFLSKKESNYLSNRFLGWLLLSFSLVSLEIFLCYTNLMFAVIHLVDFSEPANFLFAPLSFLYIQSKIQHRFDKRQYWHFLPFLFYFVYLCLVHYPQSSFYKYNAYISAYHPHLPLVKSIVYLPYAWAFFFKDHVNELTLVQFLVYIFLSFYLIYNALNKKGLSFFSNQDATLAWCRNLFFQMLSVILLFMVVKLTFDRDLGDHILAAHITLIVYLISFQVIRQSIFFHHPTPPRRPYEKSTLTTEVEENTLSKLKEIMNSQKPFLSPDFSLPTFAKMLKVSPHHLSQILNESLSQNFFEFTAFYRIEESKLLLADKENAHLKIEEIAERVGYNSKSAFNTSFKKIVGMTPSEFRKSKIK